MIGGRRDQKGQGAEEGSRVGARASRCEVRRREIGLA